MNYLVLVTGFAILFLLGTVFLIAPTLRPRIAFGRTVAEDFTSSPGGRRLLWWYRLAQIALLAVVLLTFLVLGPLRSTMLPVLFAYIALASAIWVLAYRSTRPYAVHMPLVRTAALVPDRRIEIVHLLALVPLALTALILALAWPHLPDTFPIHWSVTGQPTGLVFRSLPAVFAPVALGIGLVSFLWLLLRYATPGTGRLRWILPCIAWYTAMLNSVIALLPLRHDPAARPIGLFYTAPIVILLICAIVIATHLRQPRTSVDGDGTPDSSWVAGVFYYNPQDRALWVEKRFGIGWTLNFARPASWLMLGALLIPILAVAWFAHLAVHPR